MDETKSENNETMKLRSAFLKYAICCAVFILASTIIGWLLPELGIICFVVYIGCGIYLNRVVLRNLIDWHPMFNTLANVSGEKLKHVFLWPITYLILFIQIGIDKVL